MRLINADPDKCEPFLYEHLDDNGMAAAQNAINEMPTAYDVEKVIEQLDKAKEEYGGGFVRDYNVAIEDAKEIVRRGGVDHATKGNAGR